MGPHGLFFVSAAAEIFLSQSPGLNRGPPLYESGALPTELLWHVLNDTPIHAGAKTEDRTRDLSLHAYLLFRYRRGLDCILIRVRGSSCQSFGLSAEDGRHGLDLL